MPFLEIYDLPNEHGMPWQLPQWKHPIVTDQPLHIRTPVLINQS